MSSRHQYSISPAGVLGASATVLVTTLEDCVWLIPFVAQAARVSPRIAFVHATIFVATFTACSVAACSIAVLLSSAIVGSITDSDLVLEVAGATLCWIFAGYFYYQAYRKKIARRAAAAAARQQQSTQDAAEESLLQGRKSDGMTGSEEPPSSYQSTETQIRVEEGMGGASVVPPPSTTDSSASNGDGVAQPWMIVSLTFLGSLDEISYFPALIVGEIFTSAELIVGTVVASLLILILVESMQRYCHGCLKVLDRIPLYAVIAVFAVVLSIEAIYDAIQDYRG